MGTSGSGTGTVVSAGASLVTQAQAQAYCGLPDGQWTAQMDTIHQAVEDAVEDYCRRTFASTAYAESYNGHGKPFLFLRQYPIIDVTRVSIGKRAGIYIKNTNSNVTANASVVSTGLRLTYQGSTNSTVLFATYASLSTVVTAINAIGSGWTARLANSNYGSFLSSELAAVGQVGQNCADNNEVSLDIPEQAEDGVVVYIDEGYIQRSAGWPRGSRNIYVGYTAGYTSIPLDLQLAVKIMIKLAWQKRDEETFGTASLNIAGAAQSFITEWAPPEVLAILNRYRRPLV